MIGETKLQRRCRTDMRIIIVASIVFVTTPAGASTARRAVPPERDTRRPQPGAVHGGGRIAHSEFHDDDARHGTFEVVLATRSTDARELTVPIAIPAGQVITGMAIEIGGTTLVAVATANDEAHEAYDDVVAQLKDPALLEWKDSRHVLLHVYPVENERDATVTLTLVAADTIEGHGAHLDAASSLVASPYYYGPNAAPPRTTFDPNDPYANYWPSH